MNGATAQAQNTTDVAVKAKHDSWESGTAGVCHARGIPVTVRRVHLAVGRWHAAATPRRALRRANPPGAAVLRVRIQPLSASNRF